MASKKKRTPEQLRSTAYHESGHAVVKIVLDLTFKKVSIIPEEDSSGRIIAPTVGGYECHSKRDRRVIARRIILANYAGLHAERLIDPNAPDLHGCQDELDAFQTSVDVCVFPRHMDHVGDVAHSNYLDRLRSEAGRLVNRQRRAITELAEELLKEKELDWAATKAIVGPFLTRV
jgi:ATP-dependent Zn protease